MIRKTCNTVNSRWHSHYSRHRVKPKKLMNDLVPKTHQRTEKIIITIPILLFLGLSETENRKLHCQITCTENKNTHFFIIKYCKNINLVCVSLYLTVVVNGYNGWGWGLFCVFGNPYFSSVYIYLETCIYLALSGTLQTASALTYLSF